MTGKLVVLRGQRPGTEFHLLNNRAVIGRAEHADIVVHDRAVSRQHFEIIKDGQGFTLRDLRSGNGTYLNGQRIASAQLISGDRVKVGSHELNFLQISGVQHDPNTRQIQYLAEPSASAPPVQQQSAPAPTPATVPQPQPGVRVNVPAGHGAAPMPAPVYSAPNVKRRSSPLAIIGILAFAAVALALAVVIGVQLYKRHSSAEPTAAEIASTHIQEANTALAAHDFTLAREKFNAALQADPNSQEAADGLGQASTEARMNSLLAQAEEDVAEKQYASALVTLRSVRDGSQLFAETAEERIRTLVDEIVVEGRSSVDEGDISRAENLVGLALESSAAHPSANALQTEITELRARERAQLAAIPPDPVEAVAENSQTAAVVPDPVEAEPDDSAERRRRRRERQAAQEAADNAASAQNDDPPEQTTTVRRSSSDDESDSDPFARGWRYYDSGRFDSAVSFFERQASRLDGDQAEQAASHAERIGEFTDVYAAGNASYDAEEFDLAVHDLRRAYSLDRRLNSHYRDEIRGKLAESHFQLADQEYDRDRYKEAGENARIALRYDEDHSDTRRLVRQLEDHANEMYIDAASYQESNPARARQICRDILAMLPESSDIRGRAEELLNNL